MTQEKRRQLIRNAVFRKTSKDLKWFDNVQKQLLIEHKKEKEFHEVVRSWIDDCREFKAESVENAIHEFVEKLNLNNK